MLLLLAATAAVQAAASSPIDLRVVEISRPGRPSIEGSDYERLRMELTNRSGRPVAFNLCPSDARFTNFVRGDDRVKAFGDGRAFAASVGRDRSWRTGCRMLSIAPGATQGVTYYARGGAKWGQVRRLTLATNVGTFVYTSGVDLASW